jgi:hypothetical protein
MDQGSITNRGPDGIEALDDIAKVFGAPVKRAKVMLAGGPTLTRRLRALYRRHQIELLANQDLMLADVEARFGEFTLCYINPRVRVSDEAPACTVHASGSEYHVFNSGGELSQAQSDLIKSGVLERLLEVIDPHEGEEINISQRLVRVYMRTPTAQRVMAVIHAVIELMPHEAGWKEQSAFEGLPDALRPLIPLAPKWAISDDEERWQKLSLCAQSTRRKLVSTVVPLVPTIDQFIKSFGKNPSEEACALGDLAQAALEAQSLLAAGSRKR